MTTTSKGLIVGLLAVLLTTYASVALETPPGTATRAPSGLEVPRFVSLSADEAFMRTGPGMQYPIDWKYQRTSLPLLVTEEYDTWRRVTDMDGMSGWMHVSLLTGTRTALITEGRQRLYKSASPTSDLVMTADAGVTGKLLACVPLWCQLEISGRRGWVRRDALFGTFDGEMFD